MKPIDQCTTVAELLEDPRRWCQDNSALDSIGDWTEVKCPYAVRWCLIGAIKRIYSSPQPIFERVKKFLGMTIAEYNDNPERKHAQVLEVAKFLGI